jgi:hypothetical protein
LKNITNKTPIGNVVPFNMGALQHFSLSCLVALAFVVTPEPARESPSKLGDPSVPVKTQSASKALPR